MEEVLEDRWGGQHTARSTDAVARMDATVLGLVGHRAGTADLLAATLDADPDLVAAHVLRGFAISFQGQNSRWAEACEERRIAEDALARRGGTHRETLLVQALNAWLERDLEGCKRAFDALLASAPRDLLAIKLSHATRFIAGRPKSMRRCLERVIPTWHSGVPGCGYVLGCYAFALVETGDYATAERIGRAAVDEEPRDAWGVHAVAHVFEMTDRPQQGVSWLEANEVAWADGNNFAGHVEWHRALFHVELDEHDRALGLWGDIVSHLGDDYRDLSNASSLLFRLEEKGVEVGSRWEELAEMSERNAVDHGSAFADLHYLLVLARSRGPRAVRAVVQSMRRYANREDHWQAEVSRESGLPIAEAILARAEGRPERAVQRLSAVPSTQPLGGSLAQRDTFELLRIAVAMETGDRDLAEAMIRERLADRPDNRWARQLLDQCLGEQSPHDLASTG